MDKDKYDELWIQGRLRYRAGLTGGKYILDDKTGYLESPTRKGFRADDRKVFIERLRVCSNMAAIARSVHVDIQSVYDAIATDPQFRKHVNAAFLIPGRSKNLNEEVKKMASSEKIKVISDLSLKIGQYK